MRTYDETLIRVQSDWNGWQSAAVRLRDLHDIHWCQPIRAPRELVHAYVFCPSIVAGDIPHHCDQTSPPHRLRVCILKRHTIPAAYAELATRADQQRREGHFTATCASDSPFAGRAV